MNQFVTQAAESGQVLPIGLVAGVVLAASVLLTLAWLAYLYR